MAACAALPGTSDTMVVNGNGEQQGQQLVESIFVSETACSRVLQTQAKVVVVMVVIWVVMKREMSK